MVTVRGMPTPLGFSGDRSRDRDDRERQMTWLWDEAALRGVGVLLDLPAVGEAERRALGVTRVGHLVVCAPSHAGREGDARTASLVGERVVAEPLEDPVVRVLPVAQMADHLVRIADRVVALVELAPRTHDEL